MDTQIYTISVDWYQVSCERDPRQPLSEGMYFYGTASTDNGQELAYHLTAAREFNALFGNCLSVELNGFRLATIYCEPRPTSISNKLCLVKLANPVLYSARWMFFLVDILTALKWKFKAVSRIDLCCDFNYFSGQLDPKEFIRRYMKSGAYDPMHPSYVRVGSNKYNIIGNKRVRQPNRLEDTNPIAEHDSEYLRFGQRSGGVAVYLYNKTAELNAKGGKLYIRDHWQRVGLMDTTETPVFRLELSIANNASRVQKRMPQEDKDEAQIAQAMGSRLLNNWHVQSLALDDFGTQQLVENVFWGYATHYFRFKEVGRQMNKQHWRDVQLFDVRFVSSLKPYRVSYPLNSGTAERNAANKLERLLYTSTSLSIEEQVGIDMAINALRRLSGLRQTAFDPVQLQRVQDGLASGWSWEELEKRRVMASDALQNLRKYVESNAIAELELMRSDPDVARAMTDFDAKMELTKEQYDLCISLNNN